MMLRDGAVRRRSCSGGYGSSFFSEESGHLWGKEEGPWSRALKGTEESSTWTRQVGGREFREKSRPLEKHGVVRSDVSSSATPWTVTSQAPLSVGFSRQEYGSALPCPSPGDLPNPGIEPGAPELQADSLPSQLPGKLYRGMKSSKSMGPWGQTAYTWGEGPVGDGAAEGTGIKYRPRRMHPPWAGGSCRGFAGGVPGAGLSDQVGNSAGGGVAADAPAPQGPWVGRRNYRLGGQNGREPTTGCFWGGWVGAHFPGVRQCARGRLGVRGDGYEGALGLGSGEPHKLQVGKPRDHGCLEGGLGWSHFWEPATGGESRRPGVLAEQASVKTVLGRARAGLSPGETGTGAGTYGPQKTGRWALWMAPDRCAWSWLSAGALGVSLSASMMLLRQAECAFEASLDTKGHACRGALGALPGHAVPEPHGDSPGDGGPAGMGLAPLECAACSKGGELREMEFHPNGSHLPAPAQPLPAERAGLVPSCPARAGLGAPGSGLPALP